MFKILTYYSYFFLTCIHDGLYCFCRNVQYTTEQTACNSQSHNAMHSTSSSISSGEWTSSTLFKFFMPTPCTTPSNNTYISIHQLTVILHLIGAVFIRHVPLLCILVYIWGQFFTLWANIQKTCQYKICEMCFHLYLTLVQCKLCSGSKHCSA